MSDTSRRLSTILIADLVGFSRMVAEDADGTLAAVRAHRNALDPVILNHGGRVVKGTGDGFIAEFSSAGAAVGAAREIQETMGARADALPDSRRMLLRIGINLGDVVEDESGDLFGDGVNVAARIEPMAPPGGIAVTDAVRQAIQGSSTVDFTDTGEHELKNITRPVRIWTWGDEAQDAAIDGTAHRPSVATIAVMPFENMSGDVEQEYFSDGITQDLITALSYDRSLGVVARNSTFAYKSGGVDVRTIARDLDATHVVEGSVRRAGGRIRVTAQLIDAESGHHIWAEQYDREMADVFDLQDELVESIATRIRPTLRDRASSRQASRGVSVLDAWDLSQQGWFHVNRHTTDGFLTAAELFERAEAMDPGFAGAPAGAAMAWSSLAFGGWRHPGINPWTRAAEAAERAYALDPDDHDALVAMSLVKSLRGDVGAGERLARRAVELNPFAGLSYHVLGIALFLSGRVDEAVQVQTKAWRLARHEPWRYDVANDLAWSHYLLRNHEAAARWGSQAVSLADDFLQSHIILAAAFGQIGDPESAAEHAGRVLEHRPGFRATGYRSRLFLTRAEDRDHVVDGLRKAGLPG
ncbi:MAG: adenylate/guanylate cyclase domain-containing protein [Acidimicrobiia bacterium]|nr:adenylate/guanylate cyclase domain-containing protein [Acidimicrobiia bacterium]